MIFLNISGIGHQQSSDDRIDKHKAALELVSTIDCSAGKISDEDKIRLQIEHPEKVIALKGNDLIIDGFLFRCVEVEKNVFYFMEANSL